MTTFALPDRVAWANTVRVNKALVAAAVTDEFLRLHPDWLERYGDRARIFGIEDAGFHIDFLAAALEANSPESFQAYGRWAAEMLGARGIAPAFVSESFEQIARTVSPYLPEDARVLLHDIATGGVAAAGEALDPSAARTEHRVNETQGVFTTAALRGDRRAALNIAREAMRRGMSVVDVYVDIFEASQRAIGDLWQRGRISVAEEHMATAVTQLVLAQVATEAASAAPRFGRVVVTGVEGEHHQMGAHMIADVIAAEGWDVLFLGTNLPQSAILEAIDRAEPDVVGISVTILSNLPRAISLVRALKPVAPPRQRRIVVGGAAFLHASELAQEMGAHSVADLRSAIALFRSWT